MYTSGLPTVYNGDIYICIVIQFLREKNAKIVNSTVCIYSKYPLKKGSLSSPPVLPFCSHVSPVPGQLQTAAVMPQDPAQADKLTKIQRDLDETKVVLHKTIESMLERGEKLENLVDKSSDLSLASQMFYKQARKTNSCCKMM